MSFAANLRSLFAPGTQGTSALSRVTSAFSGPSLPQGLVDAQAAQRKKHQNADGTPKLISDGREIDLGHTTVSKLPAGSFSAVLNQMKERPDAGRAMLVGDNADLAVLSYSYGSHEPMQAWMQSKPKDDQLTINIAVSPSCHAGNDKDEKSKNYALFGKTNVYNVEVRYADGTVERKKFDVHGNDVNAGDKPNYNSPVYATLSPDVTIDLKKAAGKPVEITGWADGSAGVHGYIERRKTILHTA